MTPFTYQRPASLPAALDALAAAPMAGLLGGGTCLLDLMKQGVERPTALIDLTFAPELAEVAVLPSGALRIGAAATLSHVARRKEVQAGWPLLHEAIVDGLTPQLRNAASFAGNIMQRPRCIYFREPGFACDKRALGSGCAARMGAHYAHAIFGGEAARRCIAVHPSDLCVALTALDAEVEVASPGGGRRLPLTDLHRLPGDDPARETTLRPGELITAVVVPAQGSRTGAYVKGPEEGFALASCAALLHVANGLVASARIVLGGVAHKPWRSAPAEAALIGHAPTADALSRTIQAALAEAVTDEQTAFRLALLRGVMSEALGGALDRAGRAP